MKPFSKQSESRWYGIDRRDFMQYIAAVSAIPAVAASAEEAPGKSHRFSDYPFTLGVASGDPEPDGVVLWTRLSPSPLTGGGMPTTPRASSRLAGGTLASTSS